MRIREKNAQAVEENRSLGCRPALLCCKRCTGNDEKRLKLPIMHAKALTENFVGCISPLLPIVRERASVSKGTPRFRAAHCRVAVKKAPGWNSPPTHTLKVLCSVCKPISLEIV